MTTAHCLPISPPAGKLPCRVQGIEFSWLAIGPES